MTLCDIHNIAEELAELAERLHMITATMIGRGLTEVQVHDETLSVRIHSMKSFAFMVEKAIKEAPKTD